jgi:gamma-glutamyltranspeptidase/glutathione hydrolase
MMTGIFLLIMALHGSADDEAGPTGKDGKAHRFLAEGRNGMVVGLTGQKAVGAGLDILKQGGSAADAAMATSMTQVVEVAGSYISFAGIMSMTYYDAGSDTVSFLNACYNTPKGENDPGSIPKLNPITLKGNPSGRTALVPGFIAGVEAAHARFGKLPFVKLFEPAIALAHDGLRVDPVLGSFIQLRKSVLSRLPATKKVFTKPDGKFYVQGDLFRQPELAETLRQVAREGSSFIYKGEWARQFVDAVRQEQGLLTLDDMALYRVIWEQPTETTYRDARVFAPGFSSLGGVSTLEGLNLLELAELRQYGPAERSPASLLRLMQIADNLGVLSSSHLTAKLLPGHDYSPKARVTKESAKRIWQLIEDGKWPVAGKLSDAQPRHSSGVVVVDRWGNVAAVTHSINTVLWGNTGLFVAGISIPDSGAFQQEAIKAAGPGNRLPDPMTPMIVTRNGKPVLASTAIGGGLHQRNLQAMVNILEFGMDAQAAVDAPAFLLPKWTGPKPISQVAAGSFDQSVIDAVKRLGQEVKVLSLAEKAMYIGYWAGIQIDPTTHILKGAGTAELPSYAEGY